MTFIFRIITDLQIKLYFMIKTVLLKFVRFYGKLIIMPCKFMLDGLWSTTHTIEKILKLVVVYMEIASPSKNINICTNHIEG